MIPDNADGNRDVLQLSLVDQTDGVYYLYFSHAVLMYVKGEADKWTIKFTGDIQGFREYIWGTRDAKEIFSDERVKLEGDISEFDKFVNCFDKDWEC